MRRQDIIDDGTEWICIIKFISRTGWAVVIYQSKEELFSPIQSILKTFTFITVLLLLGVVFLAVWVLRRIMAPLKHFLNATREISSGSYDVVIAESGYLEFEELGLSFNKMAISVMQREGELINVNKDLDRLQSYLKNIINSMPSFLIGVDPDKKVTMWNNGAGYPYAGKRWNINDSGTEKALIFSEDYRNIRGRPFKPGDLNRSRLKIGR